MAVGSAGSLTVSLGLNAAEYFQGLTKAQYEARKTADAIAKGFDSIKSSVAQLAGAIGIGFGVHEIEQWAESTLQAAEQLKNLSVETGSSIEELSKLQNIAKLTGTDFETFKVTMDRFTAGLGDSSAHGDELRALLKQLGVESKDPAIAIQQAAVALNKFADGANKAADAKLLFGRGGVAFLASFQALGESGDIVATQTAEQVKNATALLEAYRTLEIQSHQLKDAFLLEIAPALTELIRTFLDARKASDGLLEAFRAWANINPFTSTQENINRIQNDLDTLRAKAAKGPIDVLGFKFGGVDKANFDSNVKGMEAALETLRAKQLREFGGPPSNESTRPKPTAPRPPVSGQADNIARRQLEAELKAQEAIIRAEEDQLRNREHFLQQYYQDDLLSIKDFYAARGAAQDEATRKEIAAYNVEIDAAERFKGQASKPEDVISADIKIADARAKIAKLEEDRSIKAIDNQHDQDQATRKYLDTIGELNAQMAELAGHSAEAATIRFDIQNAERYRRFNIEGYDAGVKALDAQKQQAKAVGDLNDATLKYDNSLAALGIEQGYINLLQSTGATTELDAINRRSELARKYIGVLQQEIAAQEAVAKDLQGPAKDAALLQIEREKLAIQELIAVTDELAKKFRDIFTGAVSDALTDAITGTKTWAQAFKDAEKSIVRSITNIASQNIAESLFGKSGALGGISEFFAGLFGGKPGAGVSALFGGATGSAGPAALSTAASSAAASLVPFTTSVAAATAALAGLSGAGAASGFSSLFGGGSDLSGAGIPGDFFSYLLPYASGGFPPVGRPALVGEHGPELFIPRSAGEIISNKELRSGKSNVYHLNVNVLPGASRSSADQAAAAMGLEVRKAMARNT